MSCAALRLAGKPSIAVSAAGLLSLARYSLAPPLFVSAKHPCPASSLAFDGRQADMDVANGTAPGVLRSWHFNLEPQDLHARASKIVAECQKIYDKVGALQGDEVTFESVLGEIAEAQRVFANERLFLDLPMYVSTRREFRDASAQVSSRLNEFEVEIDMRPDIFAKLLELEKRDTSGLSAEMRRFLARLIKLRRRDGLHLEPSVQEQVKALKHEINDLGVKYTKHSNEENTVLEFSDEELAGTPEDFVKSLDMAESGKRKVTLKHPHVMPIMKLATSPDTRRRVNFACETRCMAENVPLLEKAIALRHKCQRLGLASDGELHVWDVAYYKNLVEERHYRVDQEKLRAYFPLDVVMRGLFSIYQTLLGLRFEELENPALWHPDARMFQVCDAASGSLLGYFCMDLFPREGKYSHFCNIPLQPCCSKKDGSRQVGVVAVVCNFPKPTEDKPSLLTHSDVVTFFHEFGHTMHHLCSRADLVMFEGTSVERDFLECPSQMLENWCWSLPALQMMSQHHMTGEPLPAELADPLVASRLANVGQFNLRQITLALFDLELHLRPQVADTARLFREIQRSQLGYEPQEGTNFAANFGHLMGGYDAQYYGYLWSEVFSMDLFEARFKKEGILNADTGMDYRKHILEPGSTKDADELLRNFLGREPQMDAFLVSKGLAPASS
ncbi:thimet oligopeptidase-like isoform X3 [Haemaphysalis longicornis]